MRVLHVTAPVIAADFNLTVKRNCSISPQALLWLLAATVLLSFGIAAAFAFRGAWVVLPFTGINMALLGVACYVNGRHATDYERIVCSGDTLTVEVGDAGRLSVHRFDARRVRVLDWSRRGAVHVALVECGRELEIGRHLDTPGRMGLAALLRARLADRTAT